MYTTLDFYNQPFIFTLTFREPMTLRKIYDLFKIPKLFTILLTENIGLTHYPTNKIGYYEYQL